jgi:cytoskeletal protein CcmA (bactofilin family)
MSAKKAQALAGSLRPATDQMASGTFFVLGADVSIMGNITASADLDIDGRVEGDIICAGLVQGEASEIRGAIKAQTARLAGTLYGTVNAGDGGTENRAYSRRHAI